MARKRSGAASLLVLLSLGGAAWFQAQERAVSLKPGETLRYAIVWRLLPAGEAEFSLTRDGSAQGLWKATAKASSSGYVSNLYKVEDEYQSSFHNPTFCSTGIHKVVNEGDRHREITVRFDPRRQVAVTQDRDITGGTPTRREELPIPACVYDVLSALYYVRTLPLEVGSSIELPFNDGSETIRMRAEVQAEEEVQTEIGTFDTVRVEPDVFSGKLIQQEGRMFVWFSNDASRIPVQLKVQIGIGTITALLVGVEKWEGTP